MNKIISFEFPMCLGHYYNDDIYIMLITSDLRPECLLLFVEVLADAAGSKMA